MSNNYTRRRMFQDIFEECSDFPKEGQFKLDGDLVHQIPPKVILDYEMRTVVSVSYSSLDQKFLLFLKLCICFIILGMERELLKLLNMQLFMEVQCAVGAMGFVHVAPFPFLLRFAKGSCLPCGSPFLLAGRC